MERCRTPYVVECDSKDEMKISIIIPVYNVSAYIERCIRSVMNQTYTDFECILVDDATPDDSIAKCEKLIADYQGNIRFKIIHHEKNRGLSAARNTGTDAATGDYILYIDSDDAITSDCVEKLMDPIIRDNTIEMVMGNYEKPSEGSARLNKSPKCVADEDLKSNEVVREYFFGTNVINKTAWNKLTRRDFLDRFHLYFKEGVIWEDHLWTFYVMKHLSHLYIIKDVTYHYCYRPNSISTGTNFKTKLFHYGQIYHEISKNLTFGDSHREAKFYVKRFYCKYIDCFQDESYKETARNFRRELSIWHDPFECLLLYSIGILSKTRVGRKAYHGIESVWRKVRNRV